MSYAELHCLSNFSFLRGASHPGELVAQAAALDYAAIAITDRNSLAGVVRAHVAAKEHDVRLIIGAEIVPVDAPPIVLLVPDRAAYGRLARLITRGRLRTEKGACEIRLADIAGLAPGLIGIVTPDERGADETDPLAACRTYRDIFETDLYLAATLRHDTPDDERLARLHALSEQAGVPLVATNAVHYHVPERRYLQDVLTCVREKCTLAEAGSRLFANAERHLRPLDELTRRYGRYAALLKRTVAIASRCTFSLDELKYEYPHELVPDGLSPMAYLRQLTEDGARERYPDGVPTGVRALLERELALIAELKYEHYFLTVADLVRFARARGILCQGRGSAANSVVCFCLGITAVDPVRIDLLFERFVSKERNEPPDIDVDFEHERREEVFQYIYAKYGRERAGITAEVITYRPRSAVRDVGKVLGLSLDRVDLVAKAIDWWSAEPVPEEALRNAGLDPQARTVQMLVRLVRQLLRFPRHLSQHVGGFVITERPLCELVPLENGAMPGRTFIEWDKDDIDELGMLKIDCLALGMLSAIRKAFSLLKDYTRQAGKSEPRIRSTGPPSPAPHNQRRDTAGARAAEALASGRLHWTRTAPHGRPGRRTGYKPVPQSDLSGATSDASTGAPYPPPIPQSLTEIPAEDPAVYDLICVADTVGVFQIESRAQMSMLPRLRPRCFYDLVIEVAIVRPGPIQGGMIHPYLRRRNGEEPISYPSEAIRDVLGKTLGVPLFQEQVMRVAVVAAGFTPGEADQLRRSMAAWRRSGQLEQFQLRLVKGMLANGYARRFAEQIYKQIRGFGEYGFPESHAASFALLVYASAWLKRYYPATFAGAVINAQPMGFYAPAQLVRDAQRHGVRVLPVDVNASDWDCTLEPAPHEPDAACDDAQRVGDLDAMTHDTRHPSHAALRLGARLVRGLGAEKYAGVEAARREGPITSIRHLARRPDVSRETLLRLAAADAFRSLGLSRRAALWQILALDDAQLPLFDELDPQEAAPQLPNMPLDEVVVHDYAALGLSLNAHPIGLVRAELNKLRFGGGHGKSKGGGVRVVTASELRQRRQGARVAVAGMVTHRQRPATAQGIVFMTLEDETAHANLIIRPAVWERYRTVGRSKIALIAEGRLERQGDVIHVQVQRLHDLSRRISPVSAKSRDFH